MNVFRAITPIFLAMTLAAEAAPPRFAVVRVKDIYASLPSTAILQQDIKNERDAMMKGQRAEELRKILAELQSLQAQISETGQKDKTASEKLMRTFELKRQEAHTLQQDFENYRLEQDKVINRKMVAGMRKSLDRIVAASKKLAKERGYDTVFDGSGSTNTGLEFILYSKNSPDLTADVEAVLKDTEPPAPTPAPQTTPANATSGEGHID